MSGRCIDPGEARWKLLKKLGAIESGTILEVCQAVMPPYKDSSTPRLLVHSLVAYGVAAFTKTRKAILVSITSKGREFLADTSRKAIP